MGETYPMWKFKLKTKLASAKNKVEEVTKNVGDHVVKFVSENPKEAAAIAGTIAIIARKAPRIYAVWAEDRRRRCDYYDTRTGDHVVLHRPLSQREHVEVDRRFYRNKESYVSIFDDMGIKFK